MPDLLTHVLAGYTVFRIASLRWPWITRPYVTMGMIGTILPDLTKIAIVIDDDPIEALIGSSLDWTALHTAGGVALTIAMAVIIIVPQAQKRSLLVLAGGALSHLLLDALLKTASGLAPYPLFWPLSTYYPPSPGLYLSSNVWPAIVAAVLALLAWYTTTLREADASYSK